MVSGIGSKRCNTDNRAPRYEGLDDPAGCPGGLAALFELRRRFVGQHQDRCAPVVIALAQFAHQFDAIAFRHVDIDDDQVEGPAVRQDEGFLHIARLFDAMAGGQQGEAHQLPHRCRVIHRQDQRHLNSPRAQFELQE